MTQAIHHWASKFVGIPFANNSSDIDAGVDCWGLVIALYKQKFDIDIARVERDSLDYRQMVKLLRDSPIASDWVAIPDKELQEMDVILLSRGNMPCHAGLYINSSRNTGLLHATKDAGVIFSHIPQLLACGWSLVANYRHKSNV